MGIFDKVKEAFSKDDNKAEAAANAAKEAADKLAAAADAATKRDEGEAREAADRQAEKAQEAAAAAEENRAAEERAAEEARVADEARRAEAERQVQAAADNKPAVSVARIREVVQHDSRDDVATGDGMDKELGRLVEDALQRALDQVGISSNNTNDGSLGTGFLNAYSKWQGHLGYSGNDADGVPGRATLEKLAEATGAFTVAD